MGFNSTVRMPTDIHRIHIACAGLSRVSRLDTSIEQCLTYPPRAEHEHSFDSPAQHQIGSDAGGCDHLGIIHRQPDLTEPGCLFLRWIGAAVGEQNERHGPLLQGR